MLGLKVKQILLENGYTGKTPANMVQLAASIGISPKHLYDLIKWGRPKDIDRIAKGLRINPEELAS